MKSVLVLLLTLSLILSGCAASQDSSKAEESSAGTAEATAPAETESAKKDATGRYALSDKGEAILKEDDLTAAGSCPDQARVFYEIFVGSFSDSNGDGIGDLRGIIDRMDYLNDGDPDSGLSLGVEGLWLTPIFQSPTYHKYDITDYYAVDKTFGTLEDLKDLIALCHERDVKLILDLPVNHTGDCNKWFLNFVNAHRAGNKDDPYYDFYCYSDVPKQGSRSFGRISGTDEYYECNFTGDMPELNFDNEAVRSAVLEVAKFYLDLGVDGFRFDAAKYIYFGEQEKNTAFWSWFMGKLKEIKPDVYTVAEVWDSDSITDRYYGALNCFDFTLGQSTGLIAEAAKQGNVNNLTAYMENYVKRVRALRADAMPVPFLANHDTDRAAGYLTVASGYAKTAANLYLLGPGSPFIYYGEELGLKGSRGSANTDADRRLAMLWGDGDTVKDPKEATYNRKNKQSNGTVEDLKGNGDSLYNYYKKLLMIRKANPAIARGGYQALAFKNTKVGGFRSDWNGETVLVIHNTTGKTQTVDLKDVTDYLPAELRAVVGVTVLEGEPETKLEGTVLTLDPQTSVVLR